MIVLSELILTSHDHPDLHRVSIEKVQVIKSIEIINTSSKHLL